MDFIEFNKKAQSKKRENQLFYKKLNNRPFKNIDEIIHHEHEKVFEQINCLSCANCCKTTSPIFYQSDIVRAAKATKMRSGAFIDKY